MSLSLASASSQYIRNNFAGSMPIPTPRSFACFFRTTTLAQQTLMYSKAQTFGGTLTYQQKMHLAVSGATLTVTVEIVDDVLPVQSLSSATTSAGIDIGANGWNLAACSIGTDLDVWLYRHDGVVYTGQSAGHGTTLGVNQLRQSIGADWGGANYMDGQIAHACTWGGPIDQKTPEAMAYGMSPPSITGLTGSAADLIFWMPLLGPNRRRGVLDGQPVKQNGTSLVTADDSVFDATMVGGTITFDTSSTAYTIATFGSATQIFVTGDAEGEASDDPFTVLSKYHAHHGELVGARRGEKIEMQPQAGPSVSEHNPAMAPIMGAFM